MSGARAEAVTVIKRADLHFHLLPGVDDGPADLGDSVELARGAIEDGTTTVVATPHVRADLGVTDPREIVERVRELRSDLEGGGIMLDVRCGGELGHDLVGQLDQDGLELLAQGPPGARWLLVETPFEGIGADFHGATAELRERGFGVLLAHPERSADAELDGARGLRAEIATGSLAQLNAQSLTGEHGTGAERAAWQLIEAGLAAVVASDAHGPTRPAKLSPAAAALLRGGLAPVAVAALTDSGPRRLLTRGIAPRAALAAA
jgi:protein-tyrosine phosphatase